MKEFLDSIFKFDKIPNKIFFAGIVFGALYLFEPFNWILPELPQTWKPYVSIIFTICVVMFIVNLIIWVGNGIQKQILTYQFKRNYKKIYSELDPSEKSVIREFYLLDRKTLPFPYFEPIIQGLVDKHILVHASSISGGFVIDGISASYRLNKYVIPYIKPERDFDFPKTNSPAEFQRIKYTRPHWLRD